MSDFYEHKIGDLEDQIEDLEEDRMFFIEDRRKQYKYGEEKHLEVEGLQVKLDKAINFLENLAETHRYNGGVAIMQFVKELKE